MSDPVLKILCDMDKKLDRALEASAKNTADIAWVKKIVGGAGLVIVGMISHLLRKGGLD